MADTKPKEITAFEAYQREWVEHGEALFFETMRQFPNVFRGRFPLLYDPSVFATTPFIIQDKKQKD